MHSLHRPGVALFLAVLTVYTGLYLVAGVRDPGSADGHYSFLYARSLAFDGDLDFRNDYALCGDPYVQGIDRGTGRMDNPGHPGPGIFWVPALAAARWLAPVPAGAPEAVRAGCRGPIARAALALAMPLGALAIVLSYLAACRVARWEAAWLAAVLFAFASSLPQYAAVFVSSSHVFECFFASLCVWSSLRAVETGRPRPSAWIVVGVSLLGLALQRASDIGFAVVPLALISAMAGSAREKRSAAALALGGAAIGVAAILARSAYLYGSPWMLPQGRHYLHLAHAHPALLLFAPQGGLLYATPIAYLAFAGIASALCDARWRRLTFAAVAVIAVVLWISSAPLDWHAKATFGARRLVVLTPLFVLFSARAIDAAFARVPHALRGVALGSGAAVAVVWSALVLAAVAGTTTGGTPLEAAPLQLHQAGRAYRVVAAIGEIAVLPARLMYSARFGLPPRTFGLATTDLFYRRSYRDLSWEPRTLPFSSEELWQTSRGTNRQATGLAIVGPEAAVVFTAGWPFANAAALEVHAVTPVVLGASVATTWHACELGERHLNSGSNTVHFTIAEGCFDSGLIEFRFRARPGSGVVLERLVLDDTRALLPPF